jgi:quinol monooxygenase YgiN
MVSFTVRMRFLSEDRSEITEMLHALALATRQEPGCLSYVPHRVDGDPDTVLIYEQYQDQAAVEAHRASTHFRRYAIGGLFQRMKDRSVENLSAIV